jgi:sterol desaturase/sphingolipid hydroxylase (fatty acid hydroxylase superfamily)
MELVQIFFNEFLGYLGYIWDSITFQVPLYKNYFWGLTIISLLIWGLELRFPWRKNQATFRKDFWLDTFYMYFNFFIFAMVITGFYKLLDMGFSEVGLEAGDLALVDLRSLPPTIQLLIFFVVLDFVQWFTHVLLHRFEIFWRFHKVHHSVKEMGFAAHLRYHWMENILYKPLKTFGVMILGGFEPEQAYIVHFITITIGHLNHSNIKLTWGPLKYLINNPVMHLYHHAYTLPEGRYGVNYGISLSLWDYIFGTHYIPEDSGTIALGFEGDEHFPKDFLGHITHGFRSES